MGQLIAPHISAKRLAKMVEEYMGFEQYEFIKDNAAIFEQAETQKLVGQMQQNMEASQQIPVEEEVQSADPLPEDMPIEEEAIQEESMPPGIL